MPSAVLRTIVTVMLTIVSIIHLIPLIGVVGAEQLTWLYGLHLAEPNILILMRHRAILFALLGAFMLLAAFRKQYQPLALLAGYISVVGFLVLARVSGDYNAALKGVVQADLGALLGLIIASICWLLLKLNPQESEAD